MISRDGFGRRRSSALSTHSLLFDLGHKGKFVSLGWMVMVSKRIWRPERHVFDLVAVVKISKQNEQRLQEFSCPFLRFHFHFHFHFYSHFSVLTVFKNNSVPAFPLPLAFLSRTFRLSSPDTLGAPSTPSLSLLTAKSRSSADLHRSTPPTCQHCLARPPCQATHPTTRTA